MKSKRGVALAYVIVITAALLVVAAAFVSIASYNLSASQNSLESRQAYLDAKSAIEYGRAYLANNPSAANSNFTVLHIASGSGFKIGSDGASGAIAKYDKTTKKINAKAPYKTAADRFRLLGYQFGSSSGGGDDGQVSVSEFLACGTYDGNQIVPDYGYPVFDNQTASSVYPLFFNRSIQLNPGKSSLTAPVVYFLGRDFYSSSPPSYYYDPKSILGYNNANMTINAEFIYIASNLKSSFTAYDDCQLKIYGTDGITPCFLYFKNQVKVYVNNSVTATISPGLYKLKPGINIFRLNERQNDSYNKTECLIPATEAEISKYQKMINLGDQVKDPDKVYSADVWQTQFGLDWCTNGTFVSKGGQKQYPRYIIWKSAIEQGSWYNGGLPFVENNNSGLSDYESKIVYWYLKSTDNWSGLLWGNNDPKNNNYYLNVSNVYIAKEIFLRFVNKTQNFEVPEYKTVVYKADKITLNTDTDDTGTGGNTEVPLITHSGEAACFILEAIDAKNYVDFYVPRMLTVQYKSNGSLQKYQINAGTYSVKQLNLFSDAAKNFFTTTAPANPPASGSSGGSGGEITTGGVYTDGQ